MLNDVISEEKILKYFGQQEIIMYPPIIGCHIKKQKFHRINFTVLYQWLSCFYDYIIS